MLWLPVQLPRSSSLAPCFVPQASASGPSWSPQTPEMGAQVTPGVCVSALLTPHQHSEHLTPSCSSTGEETEAQIHRALNIYLLAFSPWPGPGRGMHRQ